MPIAKLRYMSIECFWLLLSASFPLCLCAEIEKYCKVAWDICVLFSLILWSAHRNTKIIILISCTWVVIEKGMMER